MRVHASADLAVAPADLYTLAADLSNLPAWWIEHLSAEVVTPATRARDAVYRVRYRLPGGVVISASCTVVAARFGRSLTYVWEGGGMRTAVGQTFAPGPEGCHTQLVADLSVAPWLAPLGPLVTRVMARALGEQLDRALLTLGELAAAKTVLRRSPLAGQRPAASARAGRRSRG